MGLVAGGVGLSLMTSSLLRRSEGLQVIVKEIKPEVEYDCPIEKIKIDAEAFTVSSLFMDCVAKAKNHGQDQANQQRK